jgi:hypothetical protein
MGASNSVRGGGSPAQTELDAIGATTLDEYRKHIEKDPVLERRFQPHFRRRAERGGDMGFSILLASIAMIDTPHKTWAS